MVDELGETIATKTLDLANQEAWAAILTELSGRTLSAKEQHALRLRIGDCRKCQMAEQRMAARQREAIAFPPIKKGCSRSELISAQYAPARAMWLSNLDNRMAFRRSTPGARTWDYVASDIRKSNVELGICAREGGDGVMAKVPIRYRTAARARDFMRV